MPKAARAVYDLLPDAATNTLTLVFGQISYNGLQYFGQVTPLLAAVTLSAYALAFFTLPVILTRRRDILYAGPPGGAPDLPGRGSSCGAGLAAGASGRTHGHPGG